VSSKLLEKMHAHEGKCEVCGNIVKMTLDPDTHRPNPQACFCIYCGQHYQMNIPNLDEWITEQWKQKTDKL
jgi:transcription elongation factor Elf1